jgi:hypothetical protein
MIADFELRISNLSPGEIFNSQFAIRNSKWRSYGLGTTVDYRFGA